MQTRRFLITINNPQGKGYNHEKIYQCCTRLQGLRYCCMADEIGGQMNTYHTHVYVVYENPKQFQTVMNQLPSAHVDPATGNHSQMRDYVFKTGKWKNTDKAATVLPNTRTEYGKLPTDGRGHKHDKAQLLLELIQDGWSDYDIITHYPQYMYDLQMIRQCRVICQQEEYRYKRRKVEVTYIFGKTDAGKSRYVFETYGEDLSKVTDYVHPFDTYGGEKVIAFEEFDSSLNIRNMLNLLDVYPLKLPARYVDRIACYEKVFILSNTPLEKQYPSVQREAPGTWKAFLRRIHTVIYFQSKDNIVTYASPWEYFEAIGQPIEH